MQKEFYERAVAIEHRRLDALTAAVLGTLRDGKPLADTRASFSELRDTLEAHIDQEDRLYYPAVGRLNPEHRPVLEGLVEEHRAFRSRLAEISTLLSIPDLQATKRSFGQFVAAFEEHEASEERLLRSLEDSAREER